MQHETPTVEITRRDREAGGRYEAHVAGYDDPAVLDFRRPDSDTLDATHTFVPVPMRGLGVGKALVDRLVEDAHAQGLSIIPTCPFVRAHLERDDDRAALIARD